MTSISKKIAAIQAQNIEKEKEDFKNMMVSKIEAIKENHARDMQSLKDIIDSQRKEIQTLVNQGAEQNTNIHELKEKLKDCQLKTGLPVLAEKTSEGCKVAFFASVTDYLKHLGKNQNIIFDNAVTNVGNGYLSRQGIFIAPVSGTYVFSVTLMIAGSENSWAHFVANGSVIAKLFVDHQQSTQTVVVNLKKGEDVSVQNTVPNRELHGDRYCTFSGFLLYEDKALN